MTPPAGALAAYPGGDVRAECKAVAEKARLGREGVTAHVAFDGSRDLFLVKPGPDPARPKWR